MFPSATSLRSRAFGLPETHILIPQLLTVLSVLGPAFGNLSWGGGVGVGVSAVQLRASS